MTNDIYMMNPSDIKFDEKIAGFNEMKTDEEYSSMKRDIERRGQIDALPSRNGLIGDGRHRTRICKELNIQTKVYNVDSNMSDRDFVLLCNRSTMKSRNFSKTQLAISAYKLVKEYELSDKQALEEVGLAPNNKSIGYVRTIADSPYGRKNHILKTLMKGESVCIDGKWTKSIERVKRLISMIEEEEMRKNVENESKEPEIDYNELINTETGRELFWEINKLNGMHLKLEIIKLLNLVYKTTEDQ